MPCIRDDIAALQEMIGPWVVKLQESLGRGIPVGGTLRAVRLIGAGDLAFLSDFLCHAKASERFPFAFFPAGT